MLSLKNIRKSYMIGPVRVEILKGVSLDIERGEMVSVVGTSGCGKSTLMNVMGFLDLPTAGEYIFEGRHTAHLTDSELSHIRNRKIGFVFQQFHLIPRLNALENVCLPLIYGGVHEKERLDTARSMLERVGMADRTAHKPMELSGGQQQRVAIARALASSPSLILADEPTGALDASTSREIMDLFTELNEMDRVTLVIITHDPSIAKKCRRVVRMRDGVVHET